MKHAALKSHIIHEIFPRLSPNLYYHGPPHTLDVYTCALRICAYEKIDDTLTDLVAAAALLHDVGYTESYLKNEPIGCRIARDILPGLGYDTTDCEAICDMIMATRVPQAPESIGARILCDADLDYLGREDFEAGAARLFHEFLEQGIVDSKPEWDKIQIKFISAHRYFTEFSNLYREPVKQEHLRQLVKNNTV